MDSDIQRTPLLHITRLLWEGGYLISSLELLQISRGGLFHRIQLKFHGVDSLVDRKGVSSFPRDFFSKETILK